MMNIDEAERIYLENLPSLLSHEGEYVLIHDQGIETRFWKNYEDALRAGYERFGPAQFMVKKIEHQESVHFFSRDLTVWPD